MLGIWRGFMVKDNAPNNFDMGEYRFEFGETDLKITFQNDTSKMFDVATVAGDTFSLTDQDTNATWHFSNSLVENL